MRVVVLSDTHAPRRWRSCPPEVAAYLRGADLILHAGDVCTASVLDELAQYAPVVAVVGNNDDDSVVSWGATSTVSLPIDGLQVAMIHDAGPSGGRVGRLRRQFPGADLVVFGHSHIPMDVTMDGFRIFNPGSPTDRRRQPAGTLGVVTIAGGVVLEARILPVTLISRAQSAGALEGSADLFYHSDGVIHYFGPGEMDDLIAGGSQPSVAFQLVGGQ